MTELTLPIFQCGEKNPNGRIYTIEAIRKAITKVQDRIDNNVFMGELDQPDEILLNMDNVSHTIKNITVNEETGEVVATVKILDTPSGISVKAMLEYPVELGFSPRGVGKVSDDGTVTDYELIAIDIIPRATD